MAFFAIHFFICNIFISVIIGIILLARYTFLKKFPPRFQYSLWFVLPVLMAAPFLKLKTPDFLQLFENLSNIKNTLNNSTNTSIQASKGNLLSGGNDWINDFSISQENSFLSIINIILACIWLSGILVMSWFFTKAAINLYNLKKSALPLQNQEVYKLYQACLNEAGIKRKIPVFSTAFLKSPVLSGFIKPQIYLPIHLISEYNAPDMRFMILHELQHYKHKDLLFNTIMNTASVVYWFNPFIWLAIKEIRTDREIACDTSVLQMLSKDDYISYGNTLINLAEKISFTPFPFTTGISGNMAQIKKRIINIADYSPLTLRKKLQNIIIYVIISAAILASAPVLSIKASSQDYYDFKENSSKISCIDLSHEFKGYTGSFVLYDTNAGMWKIYDIKNAITRISPASTFKIYSALNALETEVIKPGHTQIQWNGETYQYDTWNKDQTLKPAMQNSVTWYFQELDKKAGLASIKRFIQKTGYGNQNVTGNASSYWMNSSLKISPVEQVEMLMKLYNNEFNFLPENIALVKDAICLYSGNNGSFYGKTGTEECSKKNISGWFTGFIEKPGSTYFFATNIQGKNNTTGPAATELTFSILSNLNIWDNK